MRGSLEAPADVGTSWRVLRLAMAGWRRFGFLHQMAGLYVIGLVAGGLLDVGKSPKGRPPNTVSVYLTAPLGDFLMPLLVVLFPPLAWHMWRGLSSQPGRYSMHGAFLGRILGIVFIFSMGMLDSYGNERRRQQRCPSPDSNTLSMREFAARYRCGGERSIDRSMELLAAANKTFSSRDITDFLSEWRSTQPQWSVFLFRIQIVNRTVHSVPWRGASPPPKASRGLPKYNLRLQWVLKDLDKLSRMVVLPDVDFLFWAGDRFGESTLPASFAPEHAGHSYGPVFMQDKRAGLKAIITPSRSMRECRDFAKFVRVDYSVPWEGKIPKAVFRGSTTGGLYDVPGWRDYPRSIAVLKSKEHPELLDAAFHNLKEQTTEAAREEMKALGLQGNTLSHEEQLRYKMILNIDGNSLADRFLSQLAGNSVILKQDSDDEEYWYDELIPNTHYIPVKRDLSDLIPTINRSLSAAGEEHMKRMLNAGSDFVLSRLNPDNCWCYWANLLERYSKFMGEIELADGSEPWCIAKAQVL